MKKNKDNFAVLILTHGRPKDVITINTLRKSGYTGKIYLIIDDEDDTADQYFRTYGDMVIQFSKAAIAPEIDTANNTPDHKGVIYARNAMFQIAKDLGLDYFIQLEDDYTSFSYRFDEYLHWNSKTVRNLDGVFRIMVEFYKNTPIASIALAQGGDFIGGSGNAFSRILTLRRKCMNSFIFAPDRRVPFPGKINEDVNAYTDGAVRGLIFFTLPFISLSQEMTQATGGGMTEIYRAGGTYLKSFYSVIFQPSCVKISYIRGAKNSRIHHQVSWKNCTPMIMREDIKKK